MTLLLIAVWSLLFLGVAALIALVTLWFHDL